MPRLFGASTAANLDYEGAVVPAEHGVPGALRVAPGTQGLGGVACGGTVCEALAGTSTDVGGAVLQITHGRPGTPRPSPVGDFAGDGEAGLGSGIACSSPVPCVAVGSYGVVSVTKGQPGPVRNAPGAQALDSIACPSYKDCVAIGNEHNTEEGGLVTVANGRPESLRTIPTHEPLNGIACTSPGACVAVGSGIVVPITNGIPGAALLVPGSHSYLEAVACPSATDCVAVGSNASGQYSSGNRGIVLPITQGKLGAPEVVPGTSGLNAVACPTTTTCEAVGKSANEGAVVSIRLAG